MRFKTFDQHTTFLRGLMEQTDFFLISVVWSSSLVRDSAVIHSSWIEPLELSVLVVSVLLLKIFLGPVYISGLGGQSSDVKSDKGDSHSHDHKQRLQSDMVLQGLDGHSLHGSVGVVGLATSMSRKIRMVSSTNDLC